MRKILVAGVCALALTATGAMAQNAEGQGGQPSTKSGGVKPGADMKAGGGAVRHNDSNTTGMSKQDRATVPGSLNAGGTSQSSPNTTQPGASKEGR
ncbi:MAG: hypothetical protein G4V63_28190 [Candidatus Afipia apatlaquensis]|uniref:Uncharacterized protein n=1 Tax=Candidatus Afipia apatlaquensis TaxID=2712852 RepID=A0A7C9RK69_9BRAD|nr:hypothetical protein [Candidatus Afipia apatlaquensis]